MEDFGDGEYGVDAGAVAFAFMDFEEWLVAGGVMFDEESFFFEFSDEFCDGTGLVEFDEAGASAGAVGFFGGFGGWVGAAVGRVVGVRFEEAEVGVVEVELSEGFFVEEVVDGFVVALADVDEVARQLGGGGVSVCEVIFEVASVSADGLGEFMEALEEGQDFSELGGGEFFAVGDIFESDFIGAEADEDFVELGVVGDVFFAFFSTDAVEGWACDIDVTAAEELGHLAIEEG